MSNNAVSSLLARAQTHSNCHVGVMKKQIVIFTVKAVDIEERNFPYEGIIRHWGRGTGVGGQIDRGNK